MRYAVIIVSMSHKNIDHVFHYKIPAAMEGKLMVGMRVFVPFGLGNKRIEGYIIGFSDTSDFDDKKIKYIDSMAEEYPLFNNTMILLAYWMKDKYYSTLSECLQCIIPKPTKDKTFGVAYINDNIADIEKKVNDIIKKRNKQSRVLEMLSGGNEIPVNHIKSMLDIDNSPISALIKKEIIKLKYVQVYRGSYNALNIKTTDKLSANDEQKYVIDYVIDKLWQENKKPILLHGVTGGGKTEVYLQIISEVLSKDKQAIVLVPEISLTPQTVERFISRFGNKVAVTHSRLSDGERFDQWTRARNGEISIMIGPRSAIFTPFNNLGIIIIDEEHENTYKADQQSPKYDAREVAIKRGELEGCTVLMGSATPSVISYYSALNNEYELLEIKKRVNLTYPIAEIVDMREELAHGNKSIFSNVLYEAIKKNIEEKKQTILFLNRRGFSTFVSCRQCGHVMMCNSCNVNYTYHKENNRLLCHYCGSNIPNPTVCPVCQSKYIKYFGIGTEKIETEITELFPEARVLRMDLDTTRKKNSHTDILNSFKNGNADILIGTQMIAKGLDFPNVTLVGVIAADMSLNINDYHSGENTFQLITQVSGRAGRAETRGRVYIQTYNPEHYSIQCAKDNNYIRFYKEEIAFREQLRYPPFANVFFIMFSCKDEKKLIKMINKLLDIMKYYNKKSQFEHIGPAPAIISKIKDKYRWRLIVKGQDEVKLKNYVIYCLEKLEIQETVKDINISIVMNPNYGF